MQKILFCFGTRPEAIKMAPLILKCSEYGFAPIVCLTGQHKEMLQPFVDFFKLPVHHNLKIMKSNQSLSQLTAAILLGMDEVFEKFSPDILLVQGDTTSTFTCALSAFYKKLPIGHVEAGLRTYNKYSPFPEEANRQMTTNIADIHFAPTQLSKENLHRAGVQDNVLMTGNTSIDALRITLEKLNDNEFNYPNIDFNKRILLVTSHRRENLGAPQENIFNALLELLEKFEDIEIVFPVHLNPMVQEKANHFLRDNKRIHLLKPLDYKEFIWMMKKSYLILSDSGGVQEEAPYLNIPVLVLRENTERPEGVTSGTSTLVGTDKTTIVKHAEKLLSDKNHYATVQKKDNPFGDGHASDKILKKLQTYLH